MNARTIIIFVLFTALLAAGCAVQEKSEDNSLVGAWRGNVRFNSGAFAAVKDLEFMYVFNAGGTMTESSNYDGAPPVPPAYGVWRKSGPGQFEARYEFYSTKPPASFDEVAKGGGWLPAGRGVLIERIALSEDGRSFKSMIKYDAFDQAGKPAEGGGEAETEAMRIDWK
ncbi:MAG: hypothetical protein HW412_311 [Bacteroidetes bacterium]|nr:hypothetical protein [Bacteroidota bacterium]